MKSYEDLADELHVNVDIVRRTMRTARKYKAWYVEECYVRSDLGTNGSDGSEIHGWRWRWKVKFDGEWFDGKTREEAVAKAIESSPKAVSPISQRKGGR